MNNSRNATQAHLGCQVSRANFFEDFLTNAPVGGERQEHCLAVKSATGRRHQAGRSGKRMDREVLADKPLRAWLESGVIRLLLLAAVVSAISGSGPVMFSTVLAAWTLFWWASRTRWTPDASSCWSRSVSWLR